MDKEDKIYCVLEKLKKKSEWHKDQYMRYALNSDLYKSDAYKDAYEIVKGGLVK